ncbi:MAG: InlB B-repeat-containing protein, partial [Clostridia bacterium]|nr:InlB B-repeat-containing protein [Clostridia bacterium]
MAKRRIVVIAMLAVVMVIGLFGFAACKKNPKTSEATGPENYELKGEYYAEVNGEDYYLTLDGSNYALTLEDLRGGYEYDGTRLTLDGDVVASVSGDAIVLTYNGSTYRFLKKINYEVQYYANGGSAVATATVLNGKTAVKPNDPVKDDGKFVGWYEDAAYTKLYDFGKPVTGNVTLYARYVESTGAEEFTVRFVMNGEVVETKTTVNGVLYELPAVEGNFDGWYVSAFNDANKLTYKYDGQVLEENQSLYGVMKGESPQASVTASGVMWSAADVNSAYALTISGPEGIYILKQTSSTSYAYDFSDKPAGVYEITLTVRGKSTKAYYNNKGLARVSKFEVIDGNTLLYNGV